MSALVQTGPPCRHLLRQTGLRSGPCIGEDGGALIEVALLMPVVLMMLFGIAQFGILLFKYGVATCAAEFGARYASVHSSTCLLPASDARIKQQVRNNLLNDQTAWTITTNWSTANTLGSTVSVLVSNTYIVVLPFSQTRQITIGTTAQRVIVH